jgi:two-component system sensor histidine kinase/response regulator
LIGKPVQELILCQDAEGKARPVIAPMLSAATTGQTIHNVEEAFLRRDGTVIPVACTSSPIRTGGELRGTVVVFQDLTERKKFEEGLHQAQKLESIGVLAGGG